MDFISARGTGGTSSSSSYDVSEWMNIVWDIFWTKYEIRFFLCSAGGKKAALF